MVAPASTTTEAVLEVRDLSVEFWVDGEFYPAARDMSYTVRRGVTRKCRL